MKYKRNNSNKLSDQKINYFLIVSFPGNKIMSRITASNTNFDCDSENWRELRKVARTWLFLLVLWGVDLEENMMVELDK